MTSNFNTSDPWITIGSHYDELSTSHWSYVHHVPTSKSTTVQCHMRVKWWVQTTPPKYITAQIPQKVVSDKCPISGTYWAKLYVINTDINAISWCLKLLNSFYSKVCLEVKCAEFSLKGSRSQIWVILLLVSVCEGRGGLSNCGLLRKFENQASNVTFFFFKK